MKNLMQRRDTKIVPIENSEMCCGPAARNKSATVPSESRIGFYFVIVCLLCTVVHVLCAYRLHCWKMLETVASFLRKKDFPLAVQEGHSH